MSIDEYLAALDTRLRDLGELVTSSSILREIDQNVGLGFIKGQNTFADGSRLEFTEQLPTERQKFRLHYMDAQNSLIVRWDSAPHHGQLATFPFDKHTPEKVEAHGAITLLGAIDEIVELLEI